MLHAAKATKAPRDELVRAMIDRHDIAECQYCGWPFDVGDDCLVTRAGAGPFCSAYCGHQHFTFKAQRGMAAR